MGAAKVISPFGLSRVAACSGIYQKWVSECTALDAEQIRMTVAGTVATAKRSEIHDQLQCIVLRSALHDRIATLTKYLELTMRRRYRLKSEERVGSSRTQQPQGFNTRHDCRPGAILTAQYDCSD